MGHRGAERAGDPTERLRAQTGQRPVGDLVLGPGTYHDAIPPVERDEPGQPGSEHGSTLGSGGYRAERRGEFSRFVGALRSECAKEVFLVGEIQIEGPVGDARDPHDIVHPGRVVALLGERGHRGGKQARTRGLALTAKRAICSTASAPWISARSACGHSGLQE